MHASNAHVYGVLLLTRLIRWKSWDVATRHPAYHEYGTGNQNQRAHSDGEDSMRHPENGAEDKINVLTLVMIMQDSESSVSPIH